MRIDFQRLRHGPLARSARRLLYRALVGPGGWPPTFRRPQGAADGARGVSPDLYVHLPFCRQICPHCPYDKVPYEPALHRQYAAALGRELAAWLAGPGVPPIRSLYFGGGTPTATPDLIDRVLERLRDRLLPQAEIGVEVHPADASTAMLERLRRGGVNRISLGVETFEPRLLQLLGRRYTPQQAADAIGRARAAGFDCVDANLIHGIPDQDPESAIDDARRCLGLGIDQLSAYPLFTFLHTPLGRSGAQARAAIVDDRVRMRAQRGVSAVCRAAGLERTSVWSWTRPGVAPYSTVTREDYVGFGAGAGSKVGGRFAFNTFSVPEYCASVPQRPALVLDAGEGFRRFHWLYWQLYRTRVDAARYRELFGRDLFADHGRLLWLLRVLGHARRIDGGLRLTERGAVQVHRLQCLFSLTWIDELWSRCQAEPWPDEVVLV